MKQVWEYKVCGKTYRGIFLAYYDRGGTDVTYKFHRLDESGNPITYSNGGILIDMVSGSYLKNAKRIGVA